MFALAYVDGSEYFRKHAVRAYGVLLDMGDGSGDQHGAAALAWFELALRDEFDRLVAPNDLLTIALVYTAIVAVIRVLGVEL